MRPRLLGRWAAASVLVVLLACDSERAAAEKVVRAYNEASILAYRTRDLEPLKAMATPKEWGRVVVLVDLKAASQLVLESELHRLEVASAVRPAPDLFLVETEERWSYFDRPLAPGKPRGVRFVAEMRMQYEVQREAGGPWKIASTRTLSSSYLEPEGFRPGRPLHGRSREDAPPPSADGGRSAP